MAESKSSNLADGKPSRSNTALIVVPLIIGLIAAGWFAFSRLDQQSKLEARRLANRKKTSNKVDDKPPAPIDEKQDFSKFVGSQACAECHEDIAAIYAESGHSRTFHEPHEMAVFEQMAGKSFKDPYRNLTFKYHTQGQELLASIPGKFDAPFPLQYAFGSGENGVSFVTLVPDKSLKGSHGIEHRVTWIRNKDGLGFTPLHEKLQARQNTEYFGRLVSDGHIQRCVSCHTTTSRIENQQVVDLLPNVGCERCHGPGADHIAAVSDGLDDLKIRFTKGNWTPDDEIKVCAECHRSVDELPDFVVQPDELRIIRFQTVGLVKSKCYEESGHAVSCSTCHNPHEHVKKRSMQSHVNKCIECHSNAESQTLCGKSETDNCVSCHMPKIEVHSGMFFHDHWIRIRSETEPGVMRHDPDLDLTPID